MNVRHISVLSMAKVHALAMGFLGLLAGIIYSFGGLLIDAGVTVDWITSNDTPGLSMGTALAFGALIGMPIIFATFGFVVGAVTAILFNCISHWFGGINMHFK